MGCLRGSNQVSDHLEFRTPEQEVLKFLEECAEIRLTLKTISAQLGRMELRAKRAFPAVVEQLRERKNRTTRSAVASITPEQALAEFDRIVKLASSGASQEAERALEKMAGPDLLLIAKELGVSFPKSKPSVKATREAIFGKVRESILLTRHNPRP
jgi:phosphoglycolate phosphatase-like HAD superfamily hydrolase